MIPITKSSLFCLLTLAATLAAQGDAVDLRIQAKKGASVWISKHEKSENLIDVGGQSIEQAQDVTTVLQVTVKDVDDQGMLVVETKVARIHGSMTVPMLGDVEFDSAAPADEDAEDEGGGFGMPTPGTLAKAQTALAGKSFVAKVGADGKVASLEGVADLLQQGKANPMMPGPSEDSLRSLVETAFGMVPEKPVAVGSVWERKVHEDSGQPAVAMKLTLAKVDADSYEVTADGKIENPKPSKDKAGNTRAQMMESLKISDSKATGTQRVSRTDGFVIEATTNVSMDATMDAGMGEASMSMKGTTKIQRTTAEAAMPAKTEAAK